jgi:hypothetical protein
MQMPMEKRVAVMPNGIRRKVHYWSTTGRAYWNTRIEGRQRTISGLLEGEKFIPDDPVMEQWIKKSYAPERQSVEAMSTELRQKLLRRVSIQEDLRLEFPDGCRRRAYYTSLEKTGAWGKDGNGHYVRGRIVGDRLIP